MKKAHYTNYNNKTSNDNTLSSNLGISFPIKMSRKKEIPMAKPKDKVSHPSTATINSNHSHFKSNMSIDADAVKSKCKVTNNLFKQSENEFIFKSSVQRVATTTEKHNPIIQECILKPTKVRDTEIKPTEYLKKHNDYLSGYMNSTANQKRAYIYNNGNF
jgi:hypothetical protein